MGRHGQAPEPGRSTAAPPTRRQLIGAFALTIALSLFGLWLVGVI